MAAFPELQVKEGRDLLVLADEALIEAKSRGRNRSLLNLGRGSYRTADGEVLAKDEPASEPQAPTPTLGRVVEQGREQARIQDAPDPVGRPSSLLRPVGAGPAPIFRPRRPQI